DAEAEEVKELLKPLGGAWQPEFWAGPPADRRYTEFQAIREDTPAGCADQLLALARDMRTKADRLRRLAQALESPDPD
ncbi:MAG: hypothetical protein ACRD0U_04740, partial [Acidimicrobiales bacterium]